MTSSELTGGAGFTFEDAVASYYLVALLNATTATGLEPRMVSRVALQQASFGEPLDDVIVDAELPSNNSTARLSLQVKRALTISNAATNSDFREIVQNSWRTLQKPDFRSDVDRFGAVTGTVAEASFRNFVSVCEWARASQTTESFIQRFRQGGDASQAHQNILAIVRNLIQELPNVNLSDDLLYRFFRHFVLIKLDLLHEGAATDAEVVTCLQRALVSSQVGRAGDLWRQLRQIARDGSGRSEEFSRGSVLQRLTGDLMFVGSPLYVDDLSVLREMTRSWLLQQSNEIGGIHIDRPGLEEKLVDEMSRHRLTLIKGLPGTGKSALLHDILSRNLANGSTVFLSSNRLSGRSWIEFARAMGLANTGIEPLLFEVSASGQAVLFIDGLDRVAPGQRAIITDLVSQIVASSLLSNWRIVATARDAGIEPLRNWLPPAILAEGGVGYVDVQDLDNEEAAILARALPALRPLFFSSDERVRNLARRPFFASVLARGFSSSTYPTDFAPRSEVDLIEAWWSGGGYDAQAPQTLARQRALVELARQGAADLGRNIRLGALTPATQDTFPVLEQDELVQQVRQGHHAQFAHDIFFEWAFFHLLIDQGHDWVNVLSDAGEPPALARVVELFSQWTYPDASAWRETLRRLQDVPLRPQWLRAWILAPLFSPRFIEQVGMFTEVMAGDDYRLLKKLLVWMQAEKTTPNPLILSGDLGPPDLEASARIRLADALGWPSDMVSWSRLLHWAINLIDTFPDQCLGDLVSLFETWQTACADFPNPVSGRLLEQCTTWLNAIEDDNQAPLRRYSDTVLEEEPRVRIPSKLETELRSIVLRSARSYSESVGAYLTRFVQLERLPDDATQEIMTYAPLLSQTHAEQLAEVARRYFLKELPDDTVIRWRQEAEEQSRRRQEILSIPEDKRSRLDSLTLSNPYLPNTFSHHDWDRLSIGGYLRGYFPASPLREPFHSLLSNAPEIGLSFIRDLVNHAITAWRQMHSYMRGYGTPLPLALEFPWGQQEFWGSTREYMWYRGHGAPNSVNCALMALERWAFRELENGRTADDVIEQLLEGHSCITVLGIAVFIALHTQNVSTVTLPLITSQRLWHSDLNRYVQEGELQSASFIGFEQTKMDQVHRVAIEEMNGLPARKNELRNLTPLFVLSADAELSRVCRNAIENFPQELSLEYAEEARDEDHVANLRHTAEIWAEWGRNENYAVTQVPYREDVVGIELRNPRQSDPEVQQAMQRHNQTSRELELWLWVTKCFNSSSWVDGFTIEEAIARAIEVAGTITSGDGTFMPDHGIARGAIAGTAAAICCFTDDGGHQDWADQTIETFRVESEPQASDVVSGSVIPWHPKIFVAHALASRIRSERAQEQDRDNLYQLVTHPLEVVSLAAIRGVANCWDQDSKFAWCGISLGLRLAQYIRSSSPERYDWESSQQEERLRRDQALIEAIAEYQGDTDFPAWVRPLPYWTQEPPAQVRRRVTPEEDGWYRSDAIWIGSFAAKVLSQAPLSKIMDSPARDQYLQAHEVFVEWTMESLNPTWRTDQRRGREREGVDLLEWQGQLGQILAFISDYLPAEEMQTKLLNHIFEQPDDICMSTLSSFVRMLVACSVVDAPQVDERVLTLLDVSLDRMLQHGDLHRTGYRAGEIYGFDLPDMIKAFLFVLIDGAGGAARFANGEWGDLPKVMPIVEKMVRNAGWVPFVAQQFVTLCERSGENFPADRFAALMLAQIDNGQLPNGWKGTTIPAGVAGLVQEQADRNHPLSAPLARDLLYVLDALVDLGDRRSAALQQSEAFRGVVLSA